MVEQLKPCPFCGGRAEYTPEGEWQYYDAWSIRCEDCEASKCGETDMRKSEANAEAEAIAAWNTRAIETELLEALESLIAMRSKCFIPNEGDWWDDKARAAIAKARGYAFTKIEDTQP